MAGSGSSGAAEVRERMVLDFTRINSLYDIKRVCLNIHNEDNISVLINSSNFNSVSFDSQNEYNLYGYGWIDFKGNTFINYSTDLARSTETYRNKGDKNRYSNYKYAYHYPSPQSNWSKFSRFKSNNTTARFSITTNDYYSFLSLFDTTVYPYMYSNYLELTNSNGPEDNKSVEYHGRNIYKDRNFIYLKVDDNMYLNNGNYVTDVCKYMVFELEPTRKKYNLDGIFSLCNTHAYIVNASADKLNITDLTGLLKNCKATKFGDITDSRTILNLTNVDKASFLCYNSNVEDMSMHTIRLNKSANKIDLHNAFGHSKIKKLPAGLIESMSGGFKYLDASGIFYNFKNFETDISKINLPTLGSTPSIYYLYQMYMLSNCRHINKTIISTNDHDIINADSMYKDTTLIEDSPLPNSMFKNYKNTSSMFENVVFKTADTFKYIYSEFAKGGAEYNYTSFASAFRNITIVNNIQNYKAIIGAGDDYVKTSLTSFWAFHDKLSESEMIRLSVIGRRRLYKDEPIPVEAACLRAKELSFGSRVDDIKRAADAGNIGEFAAYFIKPDIDFKNGLDEGESGFFNIIIKLERQQELQMFRRLSMLLAGDDYYRVYNYLFNSAFKDRGETPNISKNYKITSILYSNTNKTVDMLSLDEIISGDMLHTILQRKFDNACAIINTNGKNLKWTLSRYHYNTHKYYNYISVFTNAVYLYRAINAQMYFTKDFQNEKIEFIFRALDEQNLIRFLALMSLYMDPNDPKKPVGRFILLYNENTYDSKTDMARINALVSFNQSHIDEIKTNTEEYDDGFVVRDEA